MGVLKTNSGSYAKTTRQTQTSEGLQYVNMSRMVYENTLRDLLLVRQYRVEVYQSQGKGSWRLTLKVTATLLWTLYAYPHKGLARQPSNVRGCDLQRAGGGWQSSLHHGREAWHTGWPKGTSAIVPQEGLVLDRWLGYHLQTPPSARLA